MDEETRQLQLQEPAAPENLLPDASYWPWVVGVALGLILLGILFVLIAKKRSAGPDPSAARRAAWLEAGTALEKVDAANARQAAVQCSLILRKYVSVAADDPALFETHEEFIARHDSLSSLSAEARTECARGFDRLAALKYSPDPPPAEPSAVVAESRSLLDVLHHGFQAT